MKHAAIWIIGCMFLLLNMETLALIIKLRDTIEWRFPFMAKISLRAIYGKLKT